MLSQRSDGPRRLLFARRFVGGVRARLLRIGLDRSRIFFGFLSSARFFVILLFVLVVFFGSDDFGKVFVLRDESNGNAIHTVTRVLFREHFPFEHVP